MAIGRTVPFLNQSDFALRSRTNCFGSSVRSKSIGRKSPASRRTLYSPLQFGSFAKKPVVSKFPRKMGPAVAYSGGREVPHLFSHSHLALRFSLLQSFDLAFPLVRFLFRHVKHRRRRTYFQEHRQDPTPGRVGACWEVASR
jgi:hypothetical protein